LDGEDKSKHKDEHPVTEEATEHVEISDFNSSAVNLVPPLEENKSVEDDSHVLEFVDCLQTLNSGDVKTVCSLEGLVMILNLSAGTVMKIKHRLTQVDDKEHNNDLPKSDGVDLSPDNLVKNDLSISNGLLMNDRSLRRLSSKRDSSKQIHHKVDPKKHGWRQRRVGQEDGTKENNNYNREVDSDLELKETSDVVVDVAAPHDTTHACFKVIIDKNEG